MNSPEIAAAKMICKSIDSLIRELYLLRKEITNDKTDIDVNVVLDSKDITPP